MCKDGLPVWRVSSTTSCGERVAANYPMIMASAAILLLICILEFAPARAQFTKSSKREEAMLHFGRGRTRRGLASALIGEIAAVIDGMEGFGEVRKLEDMELGAEEHLDELGAFI